MNLLKKIFAIGLYVMVIASPIMALTVPQTASAAPACEGRILGIPPWYRGLTQNNPPECTLKTPAALGGIGNYIWRIVLNGIEMAIVLATYVTVFFIIYGGFLFLTGGALPGQIEKARKTIINAVVGLVICMAAIALTNLVFSIIT